MRFAVQPRNYKIMPRTGLGFARAGKLRGLGMNPHASGDTAAVIIGPGLRSLQQPGATAPAQNLVRVISPGPAAPVAPRICPAWGCGAPPVRIISPGTQQPTNTGTTTAPSVGGSSAQQVAGTPVPVGYDLNSVFIASNGTQWEYSTGQGVWINVGTPYNLNAASAATPPATPSSASTAQQVAGTPVPVGYPIGSAYTDASGNTWQFNSAYGMWTETAAAGSLASLSAGAGTVPAGTPTNQPYTDASGNTWVYNPTTGAWVLSSAASSSPYSSVLDWLSEATLLSPVPNWILVAGLGLVALKFMQPGGKR